MARPGNNLYGLLAYAMKNSDREKAVLISGNKVVFSAGAHPDNIRMVMESFRPYLDANRRTKYPVFHCSLNPHPDDKLDDLQLAVIAEDFMKEMGYGRQPFVVFKHSENGRDHLHLISVRVDETGKKLPHFKEGEKAGKIAERLEMKYGLIPARGRKEQKVLPVANRVNYESGDIKRQIKSVLFQVFENFSFQSYGELNTLLGLYGVRIEHISGAVDGRLYEGVVYTVFDNNGKQAGPPFKSSLLGSSRLFGVSAIEKKFGYGKQKFTEEKTRIEQIKATMDKVLAGDGQLNILMEELRKINVELILNRSQERISGVTLVDFEKKIVMKGSRLGKSYSANALNKKIGENILSIPRISQTPENLTFKFMAFPEPPMPSSEETGEIRENGNYPVKMYAHDIPLWESPVKPTEEKNETKENLSPKQSAPQPEEFEEYLRRKKKKGRNI